MARGYVLKRGETLVGAWAQHGRVYTVDGAEGYGYGKALRRHSSLDDGLYRASFVAGRDFGCSITPGKKVSDPQAEATRLRDRAAKAKGYAVTRMPGVQGFAHAEHAASVRQHNLKNESARLADWIDRESR